MIFQITRTEIGAFRADFRRFVSGHPLYAHHEANCGDTLELILNIPRRMGATSVTAVFYSEDGHEEFCIPFSWKSFSGTEDEYHASFHVSDALVGLHFKSLLLCCT